MFFGKEGKYNEAAKRHYPKTIALSYVYKVES